jgi:RNA polymerase sigma-70 factor, ECF subfamily
MVLATAWHTLGDYHAAEDVAQETFVAAYENLGSLRDAASFGSWVLRIARRQAVRMAQRRTKTSPIEATDDRPACEDAVRLDDDVRQLLAAVTGLPEHERVVVILRYVEGHNVQAISEMTGRPVGTVTKQLSRAVKRLRQSLAEIER